MEHNAATYNTSPHCKYSCQYHIIWCPKFRYSIIKGDIESDLKHIIEDICREYKYKIRALETMPDHIHVFLDAPQTVAPADIVRTLKSITAIKLFEKHDTLRRFYARSGHLWSRGYYVSTVGHISASTVQKYIEEQKNK